MVIVEVMTRQEMTTQNIQGSYKGLHVTGVVKKAQFSVVIFKIMTRQEITTLFTQGGL